MRDILVCNTSAQQHSHAYMSRQARTIFGRLNIPGNTKSNLVTILDGCFALNIVPTWMTSDTTKQADSIRNFVGGQETDDSTFGFKFTGEIHRRNYQKNCRTISGSVTKRPNISICSAA